MGQGVGNCSTMETKYRYRQTPIKCPVCGKEAVIKGKEEYGGGWVCWSKKDGCNAKWKDGDPAIESQRQGRMENPDIADTYNTVLKMGKKRAFVDAQIQACAASDIFTQDVADEDDEAADAGKAKAAAEPAQAQRVAAPSGTVAEPPPQQPAAAGPATPAAPAPTAEQYGKLGKLCAQLHTTTQQEAQAHGWPMPISGAQAETILQDLTQRALAAAGEA
jgi:hypothetical protein